MSLPRTAPAACAALLALAAERAPAQMVVPNASASRPPAARPVPGPWVALFDGTPAALAAHWRGYRKDSVPANWRVEDGLVTYAPGAPAGRGDLVTRERYGDFELEYEWRIAPGGNSGVMWRVSEDETYPWQTGPEQQILDDAAHLDGRTATHRAGALYDLVAPPPGIARPVGEFNHGRIVARGTRVQLFLNGRRTADVDWASAAGRKLVAGSKFKTMPKFAQNLTGHIALQDHGDRVWFRNVRVRTLGPAPANGAH